MPTRKGSDSENDEFHSLSGQDVDDDGDEEAAIIEPPIHPVRSMQGAFEESIVESTEGSRPKPSLDLNAEERRKKLLESAQYDNSWTARWKQNKAATYHPCEKLISQIIFGLHLLQQQQAKSEEEVVKILQTHVSEVDTFLERTAEDFQLAINDIDERIRFLKLPMAHQTVFETMLDDKKFRTQLLDGNEKIVTIIDRTTKAMNASMLDIHKCVHANKELSKYLDKVQRSWPNGKRGIAEVYGAMRGNENGWTRYLKDLQTKGNNLGQDLIELSNLVGDMSRMAAEASRRSKKASPSGSKSAPTSPGLRSKFSDKSPPPMPSPPSTSDLNKPLPKQPNASKLAATGSSKLETLPSTDQFEKAGQSPQPLSSKPIRSPSVQRKDEDPPRPKTAGARPSAREARTADSRSNTADLIEFLKSNNPHQNPQPNSHQNPLRSNPPEEPRATSNSTSADKKPELSQSQSTDILLTRPKTATNEKIVSRSRSQGALDILKAADEAKAQAQAQIRAHTRAQPSSTPSWRPSQDRPSIDRPSMDMGGSMRSTGFARRLSKRMKHLPVPEEPAKELEKATPPPDSAYSSGSDNKFPKKDPKVRPDSILAPLPTRFDEAKYRPSRVSSERERPQVQENLRPNGTQDHSRPNGVQENLRPNGAPSVRSLASTSKSRSKSVKSLFQRTLRRGRMLAT